MLRNIDFCEQFQCHLRMGLICACRVIRMLPMFLCFAALVHVKMRFVTTINIYNSTSSVHTMLTRLGLLHHY